MGCTLCDKESIQELEFVNNSLFKGWYPKKNEISIVYHPRDKTYGIWSDAGGDSFLADTIVEDIHFCPICGRKLKE